MRRFLAVAFVLSIFGGVGCASGARRAEFERAAATQPCYTVSVRDLGPGTQGEHRSWNRTIYLDPRVLEEVTLARHVAAHELGHALMRGGGHTPAPSIMAAAHGKGERPITTLTPQEVRAASRAYGKRQPVVADASVNETGYAALAWGVALWNAASGEPVLSLSR